MHEYSSRPTQPRGTRIRHRQKARGLSSCSNKDRRGTISTNTATPFELQQPILYIRKHLLSLLPTSMHATAEKATYPTAVDCRLTSSRI
jgi:hypothetical protein